MWKSNQHKIFFFKITTTTTTTAEVLLKTTLKILQEILTPWK